MTVYGPKIPSYLLGGNISSKCSILFASYAWLLQYRCTPANNWQWIWQSHLIFIRRMSSELGFQSLDFLSPLQFFFGKGLTRFKLPVLHSYREKCMAFPARVGAFIVWADKWYPAFCCTTGTFYYRYYHTVTSRSQLKTMVARSIAHSSVNCSFLRLERCQNNKPPFCWNNAITSIEYVSNITLQ